jgi:hypothetical protein
MLVKAYKRCYELYPGRDEYKVFVPSCSKNKEFCFGGFVWIGDERPEYSIEKECEYYDKDSFKEYDKCLECNAIENYMENESSPGTKVRFVAKNPDSYGISKESAKLLTLNDIYTVDRTEVFSWNTEVYLKEFPGEVFNSVWFTEVKHGK